MILADHVSKKFGTTLALKDITFSVEQGQVVGLLGQNGAGKSTLLNILSGYLPTTSGRVLLSGHDMLTNPLKAKASLGYLPENPPLYPEMTVFEYLKFCCNLKRVEKKDQKEHIEEILETTGLNQMRNRLIGNLSKGYRQRTGLAQALCGTPQILLLDEPTSGFDPTQVVEFRKTISSLSKKHTIIFSSHILSEVQSVCQRILILHQGRLVLDTDISHPSEKEKVFFLRIASGSGKILPAIRTLSSVRRAKLLSDEENCCAMQITSTPEMSFEKELFALLSGLQTPILELTPLHDRVEDVFMRFTASGEGAET